MSVDLPDDIEEMVMLAIYGNDPDAKDKLNALDEEQKIEAIEFDAQAVRYMKNPSEAVKAVAIEKGASNFDINYTPEEKPSSEIAESISTEQAIEKSEDRQVS